MSFNGVLMHALAFELNEEFKDSYISKIAQPEFCELILTMKLKHGTKKLLISANASLPLIYITKESKVSPLKAPNFCMLLRKHIQNGIIKKIEQVGMERVLKFTISHRDEMSVLSEKFLYVEIMGKHSNIIFCDKNDTIIDSIKHISFAISSIREVLPKKNYFIPTQKGKVNPLEINKDKFIELINEKDISIFDFLCTNFIGFSSTTASYILNIAKIYDESKNTFILSENEIDKFYNAFSFLTNNLKKNNYENYAYYDKDTNKPIEFSCFKLLNLSDKKEVKFNSVSEMLFTYFKEKEIYSAMYQRSHDLRKHVNMLLSRNQKKFNLQEKQLYDTKNKDVYRKKGELILTYAYSIKQGEKEVSLYDYEIEKEVKIKLDENLSPTDNANKYFSKYQKKKRTEEELSSQIKLTENTIKHLESIKTSLDLAETKEDLDSIRYEMEEANLIHKKKDLKNKRPKKEKPLHFVTDSGFHIYVGKNNYQNEYVTFKLGDKNDMWFHAKNIPGSHVIVKTDGKELPDDVYLTAAELAGYYSSERDNKKLEIDYTELKNIKKPNAASPGFVIYHMNYSVVITPKISKIVHKVV